MRTSFAAAILASLLLIGLADDAAAQNYPWCAQYGIRGGARNCGFVSWEQCMATLRGLGGYCERNYLYRPGDVPIRRKRAPRQG